MARVLVVDDDPEQLLIRRKLLEMAGHQVVTAESALEAIGFISENPPDAMIMDLRLPELEDGLMLIRSTADQKYAGRVIVLSGWPEDLYERPEAGQVDRILVKPASSRELLNAIRDFVVLLCFLLAGAAAVRAASFPFVVKQATAAVAEVEMSSPGSDWSRPAARTRPLPCLLTARTRGM